MKNINIKVHYQSKINIKTNSVDGFEALVRFTDLKGEKLETEEVINSIENFKEANKLTKKVLEVIINDFKNVKNNDVPKIAINIYASQIESIEFMNIINDFLSDKFF